MNQTLLKRLFKSMPIEVAPDLTKIADEIIEEERKKGHSTLAEALKQILTKKNQTNLIQNKGKIVPLHEIPIDRRYKIPLVSFVERENLRHHMILSDEVEKKIRRIEEEFAARERLAHHGLSARKKILFYGPPGCGKSMSAERLAWNLGLPFLKVKFETLLSSFLGESANNINAIFDSIKGYPCVLLLDEFDFIGKSRESKNEVGEMHRIVNILLQLMEDYEAPGILIATTNLETSLDDALFRRFDDIIELPKPEPDQILNLLKVTLSAIEVDKKVDWRKFSHEMKGLSAALVVKIAQDAAKEAVLTGTLPISTNHLKKAISENFRNKG